MFKSTGEIKELRGIKHNIACGSKRRGFWVRAMQRDCFFDFGKRILFVRWGHEDPIALVISVLLIKLPPVGEADIVCVLHICDMCMCIVGFGKNLIL